MKVKFGAFVTDGRGKIGGTVYSKNKWGAFARNLVTPTNPASPYSANVRNHFNTNVQLWNSLDDVQKKLWTDFAIIHPRTDVFGSTYTLTGQTMLLSTNQNMQAIGGTDFTVPGTDDVPAENWLIMSVDADSAGLIKITTAFAPNNANNFCAVFATPGMSPGRTVAYQQYRQIGSIPADGSTIFDISTDYLAKFGALVAGTKVFVKLRQIDDRSGLSGVEFSGSTIVL